jgi:hypothetical protein
MFGIRDYVEAGGLMSMDQTSRTCGGALLNMSIRFCAGRHAGGAADQVRADDQSPDCKGARHRGAADAARPRRRGDRVTDQQSSSTVAMHTLLPVWVKSRDYRSAILRTASPQSADINYT